jgi:hypothetical protein
MTVSASRATSLSEEYASAIAIASAEATDVGRYNPLMDDGWIEIGSAQKRTQLTTYIKHVIHVHTLWGNSSQRWVQ